MKWFTALALLFSMHAAQAAPQSFDMMLTGLTKAGPHPNEEQAIRKMIAGFVENLKVKKYLLRTTPVNGGFRVCIEPTDGGYDFIVFELQRFAIRESRWDVSLVNRCR